MDNKGADQPARTCRLICAFVVRILHKQVFSRRGAYCLSAVWFWIVLVIYWEMMSGLMIDTFSFLFECPRKTIPFIWHMSTCQIMTWKMTGTPYHVYSKLSLLSISLALDETSKTCVSFDLKVKHSCRELSHSAFQNEDPSYRKSRM